MTANVGVPARAGSAIGLLGEAIRVLERWGDVHAWAGTDPYDGLNAKRFAAPFKRTTRGRQVLTQIVKRCPVDLRPLLGIPPEASAATLALAASAYTRARSLPREDALGKLDRLLAELDRKRCRNFAEPCWGYHFDVQTRVFFYPRGAPNTIATAFGGGAVLDAFERTGDETALRTAEGVGAFFLDRVPQTETETGAFFGYLVGDRTPIHNASLLAAAFLARLSAHTGSQSQRSAATDAVRYAVGLQRPDGSWPYGELPHLQWIDGYHTGYVLEALLVCKQAGIEVPLATLTRGSGVLPPEPVSFGRVPAVSGRRHLSGRLHLRGTGNSDVRPGHRRRPHGARLRLEGVRVCDATPATHRRRLRLSTPQVLDQQECSSPVGRGPDAPGLDPPTRV